MYGSTKEDAVSLVPLGRSWLLPPKLIVKNGADDALYDLTQRCYMISGLKTRSKGKLLFILDADSNSPVVNPAFVVEDWGNREAEIFTGCLSVSKNWRT